jgi:hypothetical protein
MNQRTIKPSQWVNFIWLLLAIGGGIGIGITGNYLFLIPIFLWFGNYLKIACWKYTFDENTDTIIERKGVFSVETVEIHYFRIKSIQVREPFFQRIVGLSTIDVITSEPFRPYLRFYAIHGGSVWATYLKGMASYWRDIKGVKETDFHNF